MHRTILALTAVLLLTAPAVSSDSPYVGLETRAIKALSADEIDGWLAGHGMGLALPAELNAHPGPKHVLELADELELTDEQRSATRAAFDRMHEATSRLGARLVEGEARLDALFAAGDADADAVRELTVRLGTLRGEIRWHHLAAHLEMRRLLSAEQVAAYDRLRGYRADDEAPAGACPRGGEGHG